MIRPFQTSTLMLVSLIAIGSAGCANALAAQQTTDREATAVERLVTAIRQETAELKELVEAKPTQAQTVQQTALIVRLAQTAERRLDQLSRIDHDPHRLAGLHEDLLRAANLAHGQLAEADEDVTGAAAGGLERQIDVLAGITRRQEMLVGPQLAR